MDENRQHIVSGVRSIISTQPAPRAAELQQALKLSGLSFFHLPMIQIQTVSLTQNIIKTFHRLHTFQHLIFTSRNGVDSFFKLWQQTGKTFPDSIKIAVIGKGTAETVVQNAHRVDYIQPGNTSRDFARYLKEEVIQSGEKVLLALGNLAPDFLQDQLSPQAQVERINVYQTLPVKDYDRKTMEKVFQNQYGLLVFSSPSAFYNFYAIYQQEKTNAPLRIVSIGEITTNAILNTTKAMVLTAKKPGTAGLAQEIIKYFHLKN